MPMPRRTAATRVFYQSVQATVRGCMTQCGLTLRVIAARTDVSESHLCNVLREVRLLEPVPAAALGTAVGRDAEGTRALSVLARRAATGETGPPPLRSRALPLDPARPLRGAHPAFLLEDLHLDALAPHVLGALRAHPQAPPDLGRLAFPALTHAAAAREVPIAAVVHLDADDDAKRQALGGARLFQWHRNTPEWRRIISSTWLVPEAELPALEAELIAGMTEIRALLAQLAARAKDGPAIVLGLGTQLFPLAPRLSPPQPGAPITLRPRTKKEVPPSVELLRTLELAPLLDRLLTDKQTENRSYTRRSFAKKAGISYSHLRNVLSETRNLLPPFDEKIGSALGFGADYTKAFVLKARLQTCLDPIERSELHQELAGLLSMLGARQPHLDGWPAWQSAAHIAVHELAHYPSFAPDARWAAETLGLRPSLTERALSDLIQGGLLVDEHGRWRPAQQNIATGLVTASMDIALLHDALMQAAQIALPGDQGTFLQSVALVPLCAVTEVRDAVGRLRHRLDALGDTLQQRGDPICDRLVTWQFQLIPLSAAFGGDLPLPGGEPDEDEQPPPPGESP